MQSVSCTGHGLFSGVQATLTLRPAEAGSGIVFQRTDLPGRPCVTAVFQNVVSTPRCTILGTSQFVVQTVEHLLSALKAYRIDNALIEISGPEVPIFDGSALPFAELIERAGICDLEKMRPSYYLETPYVWTQKEDIYVMALPSDELRFSYTLHYPNSSLLKTQCYSFTQGQDCFLEEMAPARTFCLYEEIAPLIEKGLVKGGLGNGVVIKGDQVMNPEGLRFPDEMVRHKVLDLIGDLSLIPHDFTAHIIAIRSGHAANIAFASELVKHLKMEKAV